MSKQSLEEAVKLRNTAAYNLKMSVLSTKCLQKDEYKNFMILKSEQQNPHNDLRSKTKTGSNQRGGNGT